jgi:ABC-2 type transport system permease protein
MTATDIARPDTRPEPAATPTAAQPSVAGQLRSLSRAMLRSFFRDKTSLFFTFLFPLMFLVVFGLVFRGDATSTTDLAVVGDGPVIAALPHDVVHSTTYDTADAAVAAVRAGDLPGALIEDGAQVTLYFAASDQVQAGTVRQIVASVVNGANLAATGQPPAITLTAERVESDEFAPI